MALQQVEFFCEQALESIGMTTGMNEATIWMQRMHPISPGHSHGTRMCPLHKHTRTHTHIQWRYLFSHSQARATPYTWTHTHMYQAWLAGIQLCETGSRRCPSSFTFFFFLRIVWGGYSNKGRTGEHCVCGMFTPSSSSVCPRLCAFICKYRL